MKLNINYNVNFVDTSTPYMLRNDGALLKCGEVHPYIKEYFSDTFEQTLKYLKEHKENLKWFYDNTLNDEVKDLIPNYNKSEEVLNKLYYLTNQEFCRVRTSNYKYKYGGDNGEIYFRISSINENWFDLIYDVCVKFSNQIKYITIMKDYQTFGKQFDYIKIKGNPINKMSLDDFLSIEGNPIIESVVIKEPEFKNYSRVWATNSASEMKSAILNSSVPLRILYDTKHRFYVYSGVDSYIHRDLLEIAWEYGLYPEYRDRYDISGGHFEDHTYQLIYAPMNKINNVWGINIQEDGYTERIVYDFGVITGRSDRENVFLNKIPVIKQLKSREKEHTYFVGWDNDDKPIIKNMEDKNKQEITEAKYLKPYSKDKVLNWMYRHFVFDKSPADPVRGPQLIDPNGYFVQIHSFHGDILQELRRDGIIRLNKKDDVFTYLYSDLFEEIGYVRCNGGLGSDRYTYLSLPSNNKPTDKQIEAILLWLAHFPMDYGCDICRADRKCIWTPELEEKTILHNINELYKLSEDLKDEVSENTLKKRRKYYLTHGLKNVFPSGLGESLDTNNIISLLSNTFGTVDEPQPTAMYILPNGKFLFTTPLEPSDDCDYEIDEHRNIDDFLYHKDIIGDDRYLEDDGSLFAENVLNCIRFNITDDYYGSYSYIQLNKKQPTSQQYDSLLKVFDYVINNGYKYLSIIFDSQYGKQVKLELSNYTADELLKKIKRYYISEILTEDVANMDLETLFSNSKIRDSKNKLLKCYHSSDNDFDKFELRDSVNGRLYGSGIYFSTVSDYMFSYGKISYECYLNIINPWYFVSSYEEIKNFIEKDTNKPVNEIKLKEYYAKGYGSDLTILNYYGNVIKEEGISFKDLLIRNNYDGIIVCNNREELEDRYTDIIVFNPNQVYIIKKYYIEKKNLGLEEDIEKHDILNPLLFDENDELKPEIKEAIEKIVKQFISDLEEDGVKIKVKDIVLVGSNVSYNYTKDSDLDVHIIVDKDSLDCNPEVYTLLYSAYRSLFNKNYDIKIKKIPIEIYVQLV